VTEDITYINYLTMLEVRQDRVISEVPIVAAGSTNCTKHGIISGPLIPAHIYHLYIESII